MTKTVSKKGRLSSQENAALRRAAHLLTDPENVDDLLAAVLASDQYEQCFRFSYLSDNLTSRTDTAKAELLHDGTDADNTNYAVAICVDGYFFLCELYDWAHSDEESDGHLSRIVRCGRDPATLYEAIQQWTDGVLEPLIRQHQHLHIQAQGARNSAQLWAASAV